MSDRRVELDGRQAIVDFIRAHGGLGSPEEMPFFVGTISSGDSASARLGDGAYVVVECTGVGGGCSTCGDSADLAWYGLVPT